MSSLTPEEMAARYPQCTDESDPTRAPARFQEIWAEAGMWAEKEDAKWMEEQQAEAEARQIKARERAKEREERAAASQERREAEAQDGLASLPRLLPDSEAESEAERSGKLRAERARHREGARRSRFRKLAEKEV